MSATDCNEAQQLDSRKLRAVDLLAEGKTDSEVAAEIGVDRSTVWRWRTTDDYFGVELARRREELWRASADRLRALIPRALEVVAEALEQGEWRAAVILLKLAGISEMSLGEVGPTEVVERSAPLTSRQRLELFRSTFEE